MKWDPEDRAKVMAYAIENGLRCDQCGTAPWEWEDNKFAYTAVDEFCKGCYQKSIFSDAESSNLAGTNVKLVPTTKMLSAKRIVKARKRAAKQAEAKREAAELAAEVESGRVHQAS